MSSDLTLESAYEKQGEPDLPERSYNWKTAIGLQQVDGLTPSKYLIETANANIKGEISIDEAERFIADYYENRPGARIRKNAQRKPIRLP